jgi:hypothetical protein
MTPLTEVQDDSTLKCGALWQRPEPVFTPCHNAQGRLCLDP